MKEPFRINRQLQPGVYKLMDVFADVGECCCLLTVFDGEEEFKQVMASAKVIVADLQAEMFVTNEEGTIIIGLNHLKNAPDEILYLDIIHELCHVKQHMAGRDLYDATKAYVDRETEIEAYGVTVDEARRTGMDEKNIANYLRVSWITPEEHKRLACRLDVPVNGEAED